MILYQAITRGKKHNRKALMIRIIILNMMWLILNMIDSCTYWPENREIAYKVTENMRCWMQHL